MVRKNACIQQRGCCSLVSVSSVSSREVNEHDHFFFPIQHLHTLTVNRYSVNHKSYPLGLFIRHVFDTIFSLHFFIFSRHLHFTVFDKCQLINCQTISWSSTMSYAPAYDFRRIYDKKAMVKFHEKRAIVTSVGDSWFRYFLVWFRRFIFRVFF